MIVIRLIIILVIISLLVCLAAYVMTQKRAYLRLAWQIIKFSGLLLIAAFLLFAVGRILLR